VNRSPYGLLSAIFTRDLRRGLRYAEAVRAGWVNVNEGTNYWESHLRSAAGRVRRPGSGGSAGASRSSG
jgi:succinate-semialdehyde dehydrogenase/glutarate-semialdehyde dehydrogenase